MFKTLVINVATRTDRRENMTVRLAEKKIVSDFVRAIEPKNLPSEGKYFLTQTAESVWRSHLECLKKSSELSKPTLILEDDAIINFNNEDIEHLVAVMKEQNLDFIQVGFLKINLSENFSINVRNVYSFFTRNTFASSFFKFFGFKEVERAKNQLWRKNLPKNFIVNDIRYGAHCYLVSPKFASTILPLNSPAFLPADDFYVALGHSKTFKMIRLRKSLSPQDGTSSSFTKRFVLS
jgi:hypothetical protein